MYFLSQTLYGYTMCDAQGLHTVKMKCYSKSKISDPINVVAQLIVAKTRKLGKEFL